MPRLKWDELGKKQYELGTRMGVLYVVDEDGTYGTGVPWNGLTKVTESPEGAEPQDFYADDIKYASIRSAETFGATVEAYTYPPEFAECDGSAQIAPGVFIGQQERKTFGFSYRTALGNDVDGAGKHYKLHIIWGASVNPSEKDYTSINDSPEIASFSWELTTNPVNVAGYKPTATMVLASNEVSPAKMKAVEDLLYGTETNPAKLPTPDELITMLSTT